MAHRHQPLDVDIVAHFKDIDFKNFDIVIVADENEQSKSLYEVLKNFDIDLSIALIIGPEGGLSNEERQIFIKQQFESVHLGKHILPTEYAHIFVLSVLYALNH